MSEPEIMVSRVGRIGKLVLNRPKALNALTLGMCESIDAALRAWGADDAVEAVVMRQAGDRAFCAGGDVRQLFDGGAALQHQFWRTEYRLNALIRRYPKPYLAFVDGVVMGGGAGVSFHGRRRIVSEHAVFAMPETAIGMVPDVGTSYELARMPGSLGLYIGLTGVRLATADAIYVRFGTDPVRRADLDEVEAMIAAGGAAAIEKVLAGHAYDPGIPPIAAQRSEIEQHFGQPSVEAIVAGLAADEKPFARETLEVMSAKSPTSLKLTFALIHAAKSMTFDECLRAEWGIVSRLNQEKDFSEGVRALIIDKDNKPRWAPARLVEVSDSAIARSFEPPPGEPLMLA